MYKKSEIEIEVLPANEGDCILITIEKEDIHILIDGGTAETYRNYLKTRLIQLKNEGIHRIMDKNKASGIDKVTKEKYEQNLEENLENLVKRMKTGSYRPNPTRRVYTSTPDIRHH